MNGAALYQSTAVSTESRGGLIVMLYSGAIRFLKRAVDDIGSGDFESKNRNILKAQDIINELNAVLDMEAGGQISANLRSLYCFMNKLLFQANVKADIGLIDQVISLLEELNEGWTAVVR